MKKLYLKDESLFAILWIVIYIVLFSLAENLSSAVGMQKIVTLPVSAFICFMLWRWVSQNGLKEKYGLCKFVGEPRRFLYFIPLIIISSPNFWNGIATRYPFIETFFYVLSMLFVGFIEEVIFRGFLFKALSVSNLKSAIIISSLTFGFGHIINLLNGAELLPTLLQLCYASGIGFVYVVIFLKGKSLWPCIISHATINITSAFSRDVPAMFDMIVAAILTALCVGYAIWIIKRN